MKINIILIIKDHVETLKNERTGRVSIVDWLVFFVIPVAIGYLVYAFDIKLPYAIYGTSITFFGIFVALLLNLRVATFGILQRKWQDHNDPKLVELQARTLELRTQLLSAVNANISYLIFISSLSVAMFLVFSAFDWSAPETAIDKVPVGPERLQVGTVSGAVFSSAVYSHFVLTLLMIICRSHILFRQEYNEGLQRSAILLSDGAEKN